MTDTVHCDVGDLVNLPAPVGLEGGEPPLEGTDAQVKWAHHIRSEKLDEWEADLPDNVYNAVCCIRDSTWWIANREADASEIKWPKAWTVKSGTVSGRSYARSSNVKEIERPQPRVRPDPPPVPPRTFVKPEHLDNFDQFARTMCKSPELAYLAIMAMAVRQNPTDATVRAKYDEVRGTIQGHLNAIDNIANGQ